MCKSSCQGGKIPGGCHRLDFAKAVAVVVVVVASFSAAHPSLAAGSAQQPYATMSILGSAVAYYDFLMTFYRD